MGSTEFVPASTRGDQSFGRPQLAFLETIDTILLGRVTYQMFAGYWPNATEGEDKPFAEKLNGLPKIVFSRTLDRAPWGTWNNAKVVRHDAAEEVAKLKQQSGKDMIVWGSISLPQSLIDRKLIDEYRMVICPIVLGSGRALFRDEVDALDLTLSQATAFERGAVELRYMPRSADKSRPQELAAAASRSR